MLGRRYSPAASAAVIFPGSSSPRVPSQALIDLAAPADAHELYDAVDRAMAEQSEEGTRSRPRPNGCVRSGPEADV